MLRKRLRLPLIATLVLALLCPLALPAWNAAAHQAIAAVAEKRLSPEARQWTAEILGTQSIEAASIWPDQIRGRLRYTSSWHYINIPISKNVNASNVGDDCARRGCVISEIRKQINVVLEPSTSPEKRKEALAFVIHFVGDIHQPLHCADDGDKGGNSKTVHFMNRALKLHALWDKSADPRVGDSTRALTAEVEKMTKAADSRSWASGSPETWALESYQIAKKDIYPAFFASQGRNLGPSYANRFEPVAIRREAQAAVRLAWILEALAKGNRPRWN